MSRATEDVLARKRVLVVEDEYFLADDMAQALKRRGVEVIGPVPTRAEALELIFDPDRLDAAVLDINLRSEAIYPVAQALKERGIPFLFTTGYDCTSLPREYSDVPCIGKPFDPDTLADLLPRMMAK